MSIEVNSLDQDIIVVTYEDETIFVTTESKTITVNQGGGSSFVSGKQGAWTSNAFPTTSGVSETGSTILDGYYWLIGGSSGVTIGGAYLPPGTYLQANQNSPTSDYSITGWKAF
jgi:hypothetical protein